MCAHYAYAYSPSDGCSTDVCRVNFLETSFHCGVSCIQVYVLFAHCQRKHSPLSSNFVARQNWMAIRSSTNTDRISWKRWARVFTLFWDRWLTATISTAITSTERKELENQTVQSSNVWVCSLFIFVFTSLLVHIKTSANSAATLDSCWTLCWLSFRNMRIFQWKIESKTYSI